MQSLAVKNPYIYDEFCRGNFVVHKTNNPFSAIAIDQAHEQHNGNVKGKGGAVGLLMDPASLRRWMVSGPEISTLITEFDSVVESGSEHVPYHHEQYMSFQKDFNRKVIELTKVLEEMESPFDNEQSELVTLDSAEFASEKVIDTIGIVEDLGQAQFAAYVDSRLIQKTVSIFSPIKKNKLFLLKTAKPKVARNNSMLKLVKADRALFSRLYIACQSRDGDLDEFFKHENQSFPPSISDNGDLRIGAKSDLMQILESLVAVSIFPISCEAIVFDGAALVNILSPKAVKTFQEYSSNVFNQYVVKQALSVNASRVDIVWDTYKDDSLKSYVRGIRGTGMRRNVRPNDIIPQAWHEFLRNSINKEELFKFLADGFISATHGIHVVSTRTDTVILGKGTKSALTTSNHEEADSRIFLHVEDAVNHGCKSVMIKTVDTDVVVIAVALFGDILGLQQLFIAFGTGKNFRIIEVHSLVKSLVPLKSRAVLSFHAFTGCDTVSSFNGRGKKSCWDAWKSFECCTEAFISICDSPGLVTSDIMKIIERFTILCYNRTSNNTDINTERKDLFTKKGRAIESLPPTSAALHYHTLRAAYQAGHIWAQSRKSNLCLPSPSDFGWTLESGQWRPVWSDLPEAGSACRELIKCACKIGCKGRCSCKKAGLPCTALCLCECEQNG